MTTCPHCGGTRTRYSMVLKYLDVSEPKHPEFLSTDCEVGPFDVCYPCEGERLEAAVRTIRHTLSIFPAA